MQFKAKEGILILAEPTVSKNWALCLMHVDLMVGERYVASAAPGRLLAPYLMILQLPHRVFYSAELASLWFRAWQINDWDFLHHRGSRARLVNNLDRRRWCLILWFFWRGP